MATSVLAGNRKPLSRNETATAHPVASRIAAIGSTPSAEAGQQHGRLVGDRVMSGRQRGDPLLPGREHPEARSKGDPDEDLAGGEARPGSEQQPTEHGSSGQREAGGADHAAAELHRPGRAG